MDYKPPKGFFDISKKPSTLTKREHENIQKLQLYLAEQEENKVYIIRHLHPQWDKLKEIAAELQRTILAHWCLEEIT